MYNKDNFYAGTKATFKGCKVPRVEPDYISYSSSGRVSSRYWYTKDGVIRASDHWSLYRYLNDGKNRNYLRKELKELPLNEGVPFKDFSYNKENFKIAVYKSLLDDVRQLIDEAIDWYKKEVEFMNKQIINEN